MTPGKWSTYNILSSIKDTGINTYWNIRKKQYWIRVS